MDFGDWPAWIALVTAIVSPVVTVHLNNLHAEKMELLRSRMKISDSYGTAISEIISASRLKVSEFKGFSEKTISVAGTCSFIDAKEFLSTVQELYFLSSIDMHNAQPLEYTEISCSGKPVYYRDWAIDICKKLAMAQNVALQEESLTQKVAKRIRHLFSRQK